MVKLSKLCIIMMCASIMLTGCVRTQEVINENIPDSETLETMSEANEYADGEEATEAIGSHSLMVDGIDYLDVEGIELEPGLEIAMIATDSGNSFYDAVEKGASEAVSDLNKALGYTGKNKLTFSFDSPKTEDVIDQINIIDQFLDKAPDALCIAFTDATACKTQMQMAKNNGIKLIAFDAPDESSETEVFVSTDNIEAASEAAAKMFNAVNYEGKIAVLVHNSLKKTGQDRYRAITNELARSYANKDIRVVDVVYLAQDDRSEEEIFDELLEKHPDLAGVICTDLITTEMTIEYAKNLDERSFSIVGFDISEKIASAVSDGTILGTVAQEPYSMGYATIVAAARSIAGMDNVEKIHSAHYWVDSSNLDSKEIQRILTY